MAKLKFKNEGYDWKFRSLGGVTRVAIEDGNDIAHLAELDKKLWTVLSMPVSGLEFDGDTLKLLDSDSDGKIRVDEITAASSYLAKTLKNCDLLLEGKDNISLDEINSESAEGQAAVEAIKHLLNYISTDKEQITMADLTACKAAFTEKSNALTSEAAAAAAQEIRPYGDSTDAAIAAYEALKEKVSDYFLRCKLISFDSESVSALDIPIAKIQEIGGGNLAASTDSIGSFPIARPSAEAVLPLGAGINPVWQGTVAALKAAAIDVDYPGAESLTEEQFNAIGAKLTTFKAAYASALSSKDGDIKTATTNIESSIALVDKLLHLTRDFYRLLQNYVVLGDFYDRSKQAIFQAGTLFIEQRCCELCIRISDMSKQGDMAGLSGMYLIYCTCTARNGGAKMDIAAVLTDGDIHGMRVGKNAIFYDRQGNDYDAVVTKIIDNPISIRQAFWSPYRKFFNWCTEKINKLAADKEANATSKLTASAESTTATAKADLAAGEGAKPAANAFDIAKFAGIFAAIGMAIGYIGGFLVSLGKGFINLGWYMPLGLVAILLLISGPSMFIAWTKLRKRDLGPVLNANGWAINASLLVNTTFGATLTSLAKYPVLAFTGKDPYAKKKKSCAPFWIAVVVVVIVVLAVLYFTETWNIIEFVKNLF